MLKNIISFFILLMLIWFIVTLIYEPNTAFIPNNNASISNNDAELNLIKTMLRDPNSAIFSSVKSKDGIVCGSINAKNSFGGYSGDQNFVVIHDTNALRGIIGTLKIVESTILFHGKEEMASPFSTNVCIK